MVAFLAELRPELTPSLLFLLALLPALVGKLNKAQHGKTGDDSGESDGVEVALGCSVMVMVCVGTPLALFYALCPRFFEVFQVMSQRPIMIAVGAALTVGGITLTCWARWVLGGNWVGGPYLRQQHQLVARGPYRLVRHPMYSGFAIFHIGLLVATGSVFLLFADGLLRAMLLRQSVSEERLLVGRFGQEYLDYRRRTGRLIPKLLRR